MRPSRSTTITIALLEGNTIVGQALTPLLRCARYDVRVLEASATDLVEELLDGVDVLLLAPSLGNGPREAFLNVMRSTSKTAQIPVLTLTTVMGEVLDDESRIPVAWLSPIAMLAQKIEAALAPTAGEQG